MLKQSVIANKSEPFFSASRTTVHLVECEASKDNAVGSVIVDIYHHSVHVM